MSERESHTQRDRALLFGAVLTLACAGALAIFSATSALDIERTLPLPFIRHLLFLLLGCGCVALAAQLPLGLLRALALPLWLLTVSALGATLLLGERVGGALRWLSLPGTALSVQPVEFVKLSTVLGIAWLLSSNARAHPSARAPRFRFARAKFNAHAQPFSASARRTPRSRFADATEHAVSHRQFALALALAGVPALLCLLQPDLGSAVILFALAFGLLFVAGARAAQLLPPIALGALALGAYIALRPYALRRFTGFLDPWERAAGEGFQLVQSYIAFARGGLRGVGFGDGRQKLYYLPEAHNDFILSVVAEETGLLGVLVLLGAFCALLVAGLRIALRSRDRFRLLLGAGVTALIALPALLNAAVVMGWLPTKGLNLPFVSSGGSALLASCIAVGLLFALARAPQGRER